MKVVWTCMKTIKVLSLICPWIVFRFGFTLDHYNLTNSFVRDCRKIGPPIGTLLVRLKKGISFNELYTLFFPV